MNDAFDDVIGHTLERVYYSEGKTLLTLCFEGGVSVRVSASVPILQYADGTWEMVKTEEQEQ